VKTVALTKSSKLINFKHQSRIFSLLSSI